MERLLDTTKNLLGSENIDESIQVGEDSESSENGEPLIEKGPGVTRARSFYDGADERECVAHKISGIVHLIDGEVTTRCGRKLSQNFLPLALTNVTEDDCDCCHQCSKILVNRHQV